MTRSNMRGMGVALGVAAIAASITSTAASGVPTSASDKQCLLRINEEIRTEKLLSWCDKNHMLCDLWDEDGVDVRVMCESVPDIAAKFGLNSYEIAIDDIAALQDKQISLGDGARTFNEAYRTYDEIVAKLQALASEYGAGYIPSIAGTSTHEGRAIPGIRFGGGSSGKTVYVQGGMHAREWISPAATVAAAETLLTSTDDSVRAAVDCTEFIFVPMLNPDGYEYSRTSDRYWRKNRAPNAGGCPGVDLNRNWGMHFGGQSTSSDTCSDIYRGTSAFSEPETAAVRDFLAGPDLSGRDLVAGIDVHSYGQLVLHPPGHSANAPALVNAAELETLGASMQAAMGVPYGTGYESMAGFEMYPVGGAADDYLYAATGDSIGMTIELRDTGNFGFLLPPDKIAPTGEELTAALLALAGHVCLVEYDSALAEPLWVSELRDWVVTYVDAYLADQSSSANPSSRALGGFDEAGPGREDGREGGGSRRPSSFALGVVSGTVGAAGMCVVVVGAALAVTALKKRGHEHDAKVDPAITDGCERV